MKKHIIQMTKEEVKILRDRIRKSINMRRPITLTKHCKDRMNEKNIAMYDMIMVLKDYDLIEYHLKDSDERVLLRGKKDYDGKNICISYSVKEKRIITTYVNKLDDNHNTLDLNNYNEKILIGV